MDEIRKRVEYQLEYNIMGLSNADYLQVLIQYQEMERRGGINLAKINPYKQHYSLT